MCQENPCPYDNSCTQREVWERLKAYEDTGLEPETCAEYKKFEDEAVSKGVTFKRIIELMEAEKDGRLVVLPCKFGWEIWIVVTKRAKLHLPEYSFVKKSRLTWNNLQRVLHDFRKTVFLTREEAEAAMREKGERGAE